jgi:hypothetical protein
VPERLTPAFPELDPLDQRGAIHATSLPLPALPALPALRALPLPAPVKIPRLRVPRFPAQIESSSLHSDPTHTPATPRPDPDASTERNPKSPRPSASPEQEAVLLPDDSPEETMEETIAALLADEIGSPPSDSGKPPEAQWRTQPPKREGEDASDRDLADAFAPIIEGALHKTRCNPESGLQSFLEPMLRSTVRRAIAEQMESSRQFRQLGALDRLVYRMRALLSSRTYDDIVFDQTHRHQVEEAYLLRREDFGLVSYAHHDPGCHVSERRVQERVRDLSSRLRAPDGGLESSFDFSPHRLALVREGQFCLLVAVLRGRSNAPVRADLDYVLRQAEDRFGARLETKTDAFSRVLQPILEGCLLILSPAPPH